MNAILVAMLSFSAALVGQAASGNSPSAVKFMQDSAQLYTIEPIDSDATGPLQLQAEPAFRLGRQGASNLMEGALFFWLDNVGRPEAAVQIYRGRRPDAPQGKWFHEFTSLSTGLLEARQDGKPVPVWSPSVPGLTFASWPEAVAPAATPAQRGRQMRSFAQQIKASRGAQVTSSQNGWDELRLLPTPVARYGKPGSAVLDGALFAFVIGTDPEVFLFVEERPGPEGPRWEYALAPMSCWPLKASGPGGITWELPFRPAANKTKPLYSKFHQLAEPETP
jgi:hypothetical protein